MSYFEINGFGFNLLRNVVVGCFFFSFDVRLTYICVSVVLGRISHHRLTSCIIVLLA